MKDDKDLKAHFGQECPFKVPEGYFEHLHEQIMESLPKEKPASSAPDSPVTLMMRIKPWLYLAAMFAGIIFMVQGIMYVQERHTSANNATALEDVYTDEVDHFMSSSLYSEYVLYSYLTTNDYD